MDELDLEDFTRYETEEDFLKNYPLKKHEPYNLKPWNSPSRFPCLVREDGILLSDYPEADHGILSVIYFK